MERIKQVLMDGEPVEFAQDEDGTVHISVSMRRAADSVVAIPMKASGPLGARLEITWAGLQAFDADGARTF